MAQILVCERDGNAFIERAPHSISIMQAVYYDERGRPRPFSGEFCPICGEEIANKQREIRGGIIGQLQTAITPGGNSRLQLSPPRDFHDVEGPQDG